MSEDTYSTKEILLACQKAMAEKDAQIAQLQSKLATLAKANDDNAMELKERIDELETALLTRLLAYL